MMARNSLFLCTFISSICVIYGQSTGVLHRPSVDAALRIREVDLTHVQSIAGLPAATVMGYPTTCSPDGETFLQIYASDADGNVSAFPDIYSIDEQRAVRHVPYKLPTNYKTSSVRGLFAARSQIVLLVQAAQPLADAPPVAKGQRTAFLSVAGSSSSQPALIPLNVPFLPVKAAELGGTLTQFIVFGLDVANQIPVLALVDSTGNLIKRLQLDVNLYLQSSELNALRTGRRDGSGNPSSPKPLERIFDLAQFVAFGDDVLLSQPGTSNPLIRFHSDGRIDTIQVRLPQGQTIQRVLPTDSRDSWVILAGDHKSLQQAVSGEVSENATPSIYEFNPLTGELIDQLTVLGPQVTEVACAAHTRLSAVYYGKPAKEGVRDQLTYASATR